MLPLISGCNRVFTPRVSWVKASDIDLNNYRAALSSNLLSIHLPTAALLCSDLRCMDTSHRCDINHYEEEITTACLSAAGSSIPRTSNRPVAGPKRVPGWTECYILHSIAMREKN